MTKWDKFKAAFSNAFGYDDGSGTITDEDIALLDRVADFVVRRRLTQPAILLLESVGPLGFLSSQAMAFFRPVFGIVFKTEGYERIQRLLERRCAPALLVERIELREHEQKTRPGSDAPPASDEFRNPE